MTTYKELDYLESTGTQYIDTLWSPQSNNLRVKFKVKSKGTPRSTAICGAENSNVVPRWVFVMFGQAADSTKTFPLIGDWKNGGAGFSAEGFTFTDGTTLEIDWTANATSTTVTDSVSGTTYTHTFDTTITYSNNTTTLKLFQNGDAQKSSIDMYYYQIYDNNTLVRDFIPVLDFNNTPAMYDKVNNVLHYNQGTGQFLYGVKETESSIQLRRKFNMLLASHKKQEYTPVKYIQSSGTQYIVSPVQFYGDNYKIECKFDNSDTPSDTTPFGYQSTGSGIQIMVVGFNNQNSTGTIFWNGTSTAHANRAKLNVMTKGLNELVIEANNGTLTYTLNGASPVSYETYTSFEPQTENVWIFGNNRQSASGSHQLATMKFYYLRIYQNNEIKYNFISVLDSNGVPCILETVSGVYYYNQGTGDFTYEEWDYTPCDYVYADGNAYTSTLWYGDSDTKMEMVFDIAEQAAGNTGSMGSRISANSQLLAIGYGVVSLAADFNNSSYSPYRAAIVYETNKKYRAYTSKEKRSIIDEDTGVVLYENTTLCTDTLETSVLLLGAETGIASRHVGNIWSGKIWEGETLVRDYIPVVDGDNKGCFYDKTLNTLFYSSGSSDFVGHFVENGVDYKVVKNIIAEQVATSTTTRACPYISTGIYPSTRKKTRMKAKAQMAVATTSYEHYLGGTNAGSRFVLGQASGSSGSKFYFGLGTRNFWTTMDVDTDTHIFGLDWATETCSIDDTTWQIPSAGKSESSKPFLINARNTAVYANANRPAGGTSYWWKFWEGKKLVYNGIPVVRISDDKAGLFETVNREFQSSAGTIEYTYTE